MDTVKTNGKMTVQIPASTTSNSNSSSYIKFFKMLMLIIAMNFVIVGALMYMRTTTNKYRTPAPGRRNKSDEEKFLSQLNQNLVFKKFNITEPEQRTKVDIILIVSSAPARTERRSAIRQTWWPECRSTNRVTVKCVFLTDIVNEETALGKALMKEENMYNDLHFQELQGGFDFGKRFLYHMMWALINYNFKYFLRMDDDYFLCVKRFLQEVPMPPQHLYHWGWVHCQANIVRPEESIILLSKDLLKIYVGQDPDEMYCHRWADQMIGIWKNDLKLDSLFYNHDSRLHHHPPAQYINIFRTRSNICQDFIGVHGSYPLQMRTLWEHRGPDQYPVNLTFGNYTAPCGLPNVMLWQNFGSEWIAEPKLCKTNPDWGGRHGTTYIGRQGEERSWDSLHAGLNSHYEAWSYQKKKHEKIKAYRKTV